MYQPLDESLALNALYQCADGLRHLHTIRLVHRDVRADNFLVASVVPLRIVITDFGLAHRLQATDAAGSVSATMIGPVGAFSGRACECARVMLRLVVVSVRV